MCYIKSFYVCCKANYRHVGYQRFSNCYFLFWKIIKSLSAVYLIFNFDNFIKYIIITFYLVRETTIFGHDIYNFIIFFATYFLRGYVEDSLRALIKRPVCIRMSMSSIT